MLSVLTDRDRLALVTFNTQAEQLTNLTPMNEEGREVAMEAIRGLRADGGTDMLKVVTPLFVPDQGSEPRTCCCRNWSNRPF